MYLSSNADYTGCMEIRQVQATEEEHMNPETRIQLIRIAEKIERNPEFSKKLGIADISCYRSSKAGILKKSLHEKG